MMMMMMIVDDEEKEEEKDVFLLLLPVVVCVYVYFLSVHFQHGCGDLLQAAAAVVAQRKEVDSPLYRTTFT